MSSSDAPSAGSVGERARELLALGAARGVQLRVLGGVAIALRASPQTPPGLSRPSNDLDLAVEEGAGRRAGEILLDGGLVALSERFNTLHGHRRLVFVGEQQADLKVDVFVGDLEMCHTVPLRGRLELDPLTLTPTDLLLSKGQIVRLAPKDRLDLYCLLWNHEIDVGQAPSAERLPEAAIDAGYIAALCARDWGWWRTLTANLDVCRGELPGASLQQADSARIAERLSALEQAIAAAPKSLRWRARDRVGERVRWFEEPEEIGGVAGPRPALALAFDGERDPGGHGLQATLSKLCIDGASIQHDTRRRDRVGRRG